MSFAVECGGNLERNGLRNAGRIQLPSYSPDSTSGDRLQIRHGRQQRVSAGIGSSSTPNTSYLPAHALARRHPLAGRAATQQNRFLTGSRIVFILVLALPVGTIYGVQSMFSGARGSGGLITAAVVSRRTRHPTGDGGWRPAHPSSSSPRGGGTVMVAGGGSAGPIERRASERPRRRSHHDSESLRGATAARSRYGSEELERSPNCSE